jgi:hypothetical protein
MDKLVKPLGIDSLSTSPESRMAADLDAIVGGAATGGSTRLAVHVVAADALTMMVREGGRVINAVVLLATGVNGDGHREVLGMRVATSEAGPAWNEFFADLVARGLAQSAWSPPTPTPARARRSQSTCPERPGSVTFEGPAADPALPAAAGLDWPVGVVLRAPG